MPAAGGGRRRLERRARLLAALAAAAPGAAAPAVTGVSGYFVFFASNGMFKVTLDGGEASPVFSWANYDACGDVLGAAAGPLETDGTRGVLFTCADKEVWQAGVRDLSQPSALAVNDGTTASMTKAGIASEAAGSYFAARSEGSAAGWTVGMFDAVAGANTGLLVQKRAPFPNGGGLAVSGGKAYLSWAKAGGDQGICWSDDPMMQMCTDMATVSALWAGSVGGDMQAMQIGDVTLGSDGMLYFSVSVSGDAAMLLQADPADAAAGKLLATRLSLFRSRGSPDLNSNGVRQPAFVVAGTPPVLVYADGTKLMSKAMSDIDDAGVAADVLCDAATMAGAAGPIGPLVFLDMVVTQQPSSAPSGGVTASPRGAASTPAPPAPAGATTAPQGAGGQTVAGATAAPQQAAGAGPPPGDTPSPPADPADAAYDKAAAEDLDCTDPPGPAQPAADFMTGMNLCMPYAANQAACVAQPECRWCVSFDPADNGDAMCAQALVTCHVAELDLAGWLNQKAALFVQGGCPVVWPDPRTPAPPGTPAPPVPETPFPGICDHATQQQAYVECGIPVSGGQPDPVLICTQACSDKATQCDLVLPLWQQIVLQCENATGAPRQPTGPPQPATPPPSRLPSGTPERSPPTACDSNTGASTCTLPACQWTPGSTNGTGECKTANCVSPHDMPPTSLAACEQRPECQWLDPPGSCQADCGVKGDEGSCAGLPGCMWAGTRCTHDCELMGILACQALPGCTIMNPPVGCTTDCGSQAEAGPCNGLPGCVWLDPPKRCAPKCAASPSAGACTAEPFKVDCLWKDSGSGTPGACTSNCTDIYPGKAGSVETAKRECDALPDCKWETDRNGDESCAPDCAALTDEVLCTVLQNEGVCEWANAACAPPSTAGPTQNPAPVEEEPSCPLWLVILILVLGLCLLALGCYCLWLANDKAPAEKDTPESSLLDPDDMEERNAPGNDDDDDEAEGQGHGVTIGKLRAGKDNAIRINKDDPRIVDAERPNGQRDYTAKEDAPQSPRWVGECSGRGGTGKPASPPARGMGRGRRGSKDGTDWSGPGRRGSADGETAGGGGLGRGRGSSRPPNRRVSMRKI